MVDICLDLLLIMVDYKYIAFYLLYEKWIIKTEYKPWCENKYVPQQFPTALYTPVLMSETHVSKGQYLII